MSINQSNHIYITLTGVYTFSQVTYVNFGRYNVQLIINSAYHKQGRNAQCKMLRHIQILAPYGTAGQGNIRLLKVKQHKSEG